MVTNNSSKHAEWRKGWDTWGENINILYLTGFFLENSRNTVLLVEKIKNCLNCHNSGCVWDRVVIFSFKAYDTAESFLRKSLMQENLRKLLAKVSHDTLASWTTKLQVKSGVLWALLYCDSDGPLTARYLRKKTFRNRTHPISESFRK